MKNQTKCQVTDCAEHAKVKMKVNTHDGFGSVALISVCIKHSYKHEIETTINVDMRT